MTIARFKGICIDVVNPGHLGWFWGAVLGRDYQPDEAGEGVVTGPTPQHTIWINLVPERKTVKHRVHLDIYASSIVKLESLGAAAVAPEADGRRWTVMADPEGGEFCAFLREEVPAERLHGLVVDSADPAAQAGWWAGVYGARVTDNDGWSTVEGVPGMPISTMDFVPVPELKSVKNRIHWDVSVADPEQLVDAGATVLRPRGGDVTWDVMADPEGNEFCAFTEPRAG